MKNSDVFLFNQGLNEVSNLTGFKFAYAVSRNKKRIKTYLTELNSKRKAIVDWDKYTELNNKREERRAELALELAEKDEQGNAITFIPKGQQQEHYKFADQAEAIKTIGETLDVEFEELDKMQDSLREHDAKVQEEDAKLDVYLVGKEFIPDGINANQIDKIQWMIEGFDS